MKDDQGMVRTRSSASFIKLLKWCAGARPYGMIFIILFLISGCSISSKKNELINHPAPVTRITLIDGEYKSIGEYYGKPLVLIFWNATCAHCLNLMPKLEEKAKKMTANGVTFLAISINSADDKEAVLDQIAYLKLNHFIHAFSGNDIYDEAYLAFGANQVPFIAVVNKDGKVVAIGDDTDVLHSLDRWNS